MNRRQALRTLALATAAGAAAWRSHPLHAQPAPATRSSSGPSGPYQLPDLPYAFDALEPHIDARTMEIHHDKHHAAYVANLNKAVADYPDLGAKPVDQLVRDLNSVPEKIRTAVRNNGGGHSNHSLFWRMMAKNGGGEPKGELGAAITKQFGSYAAFKDALSKAAMGQFGSGWAWLCADGSRALHIEATANQDSPLTNGHLPLLGLDVWEHAYYLKYQNRRADYVAAFFNVINWDFVADRFAKGAV